MSVPANLSGLPVVMKLSSTEQNELRKSCAQMICGFLGFDARSLLIYGTSYGFSICGIRGTSPLVDTVCKLLDKHNVKYKVSYGTFHDEIRVSSRGDNLYKFKNVAEKCWKNVEKTDGVLMDRYLELAGSVDRDPGKCRFPRTNSVCRVLALAEGQVSSFRTDRMWFDVASEIRDTEVLLTIQNNVEACREVIKKWRDSSLGSEPVTVTVRQVVLAEAELERLTGERPE